MTSAYRGPIRLAVFDVDGVLTDGVLYLAADGEVVKAFSVRDGVAVALLRAHDIDTAVISGRASGSLDYRLDQLGISWRVTGAGDKLTALRTLLKATGLSADEVAYVGDDIIDIPLAGIVNQFYAVANAHELVLRAADAVLSRPGGHGAAREAAERILLAGGLTIDSAYAPLLGHGTYIGRIAQ